MPAHADTATDPEKTLVAGHTSHGTGLQARLLNITRLRATIEILDPNLVLQTSEVVRDFRVIVHDRSVYAGRAIVSSILNTGTAALCELSLDERGWSNLHLDSQMVQDGRLRREFGLFLNAWQGFYRIHPEFKIVIADLQSYLSELRLWLEQVELEIRASPSADRIALERQVVDELAAPVVASIDAFIEKFESLVCDLDPESHPAYRDHLRRQLHPLILSSPFAYRAYHKPLGYAGDYEMVSMMLREPYEGGSLFAKVMNVWLLGQSPALAHRNRVIYLQRTLMHEKLRVQRAGRPLRVFNLGCGPADEVIQTLGRHNMDGKWHFDLLDFNEETLESLRQSLQLLRASYPGGLPVRLIKKSVQQLLKESARAVARGPESQYDLVYCAGLFDYLPDPTCKRVMNIMYDMLAPGGFLLATNVTDIMNSSRPFRYSMEYILDWHLIYRDQAAFRRIAPDFAPADSISLVAENTGVNVFLEVRKPEHG